MFAVKQTNKLKTLNHLFKTTCLQIKINMFINASINQHNKPLSIVYVNAKSMYLLLVLKAPAVKCEFPHICICLALLNLKGL